MPRPSLSGALAPPLLLAGAARAGAADGHSMLHPAGEAAERIAAVWWEMLVVYGLVFVITLALLAVALASRRRERSPLGSRFVFVSGIAIPTVILVIMLFSSIHETMALGGREAGFRVRVTSYHWWFEVEYPDFGIVDANEIHVPVGVETAFELRSHAVVHSFWVPSLGGKRDMLPDHPTELRLTAARPGVYRGTCTEYCAGPHALMAFRLVAHEPREFEEWLHRARPPAPEPADPELARGRDVFLQAGCAACHAIRGLSESNTGPDLTRLGSRLTLGSGTIAHTPGSLPGWIGNPQAIKPRNLMPRSYLPPGDLHALTTYLRSLR